MAKIGMSGCSLSVYYFHWWFFIQMIFSDVGPDVPPGKLLGNTPFIFVVLSSCRVGDFYRVSVSEHWLGSVCFAQFWLRYFTHKNWDFEQVCKISFFLILVVKHIELESIENWRMFDMEHSKDQMKFRDASYHFHHHLHVELANDFIIPYID